MKTFEEYQYRFSIPHNKVKLQYKYSPKTKEELIEAIKAEIEEQGSEADLNCIDTSKITNMNRLFCANNHNYAKSFNGDISSWNVGNVTRMDYMFDFAENFDCDISGWNISNVKNMCCMFCGAEKFNQDISNWDVSNVENMRGMFMFTKSFNQDISAWDVSNVDNMGSMFYSAKSFNQNISNWNVNRVLTMVDMFYNCPIKEEYKPKFN